jgi:DNA-binding NarL/FixJ family response regulator
MSQVTTPVRPCTDELPVRLPTVALMSRDGSVPPSLTPFAPRLITDDPRAVAPTDDVVILYTRRAAPDVARLHRLLGRRTPAVLVLNPVLDPRDVIECFDNGATSYLVICEVPEYCLVDATVRTAEGQSALSPSAVAILMDHLRERLVIPAPEVEAPPPDTAEELTPRECQVMELLVAGHTISEIAGHLRLTSKTVRNNLSNIYAKLRVRRQSEAILLWLGHQHKPDAPRQYNQPKFVPQLSPLRQFAPRAL